MTKKKDYNPLRKARTWLRRHVWWANPLLTLGLFLLVLNSHRGKNRDLDATAVSVTTLEIFLVVFAFIGFWVIRREAIAAAEEAARETVNEIKNATNGNGDGVLKTDTEAPKAAPPATVNKEEAEEGL